MAETSNSDRLAPWSNQKSCYACGEQLLDVLRPDRAPGNATMEEQLRSSLPSYALALCRALAACREAQGVVALLEQAAATLLNSDAFIAAESAPADAAADAEALAAARSALLAATAAAAPGQPPSQLLWPLFYTSSAFQDVAETLLTGGQAPLCACKL